MNPSSSEYDNLVGASLKQIQDEYKSSTVGDGCEMVVRHMIRTTAENPRKQWFYAWEFIGPKPHTHLKSLFGSHRAPARLSDLYTKYPQCFEGHKVGRFVVGRIKYDCIAELADLNEDLYKVVTEEIAAAKNQGLWYYQPIKDTLF